ncbi:MAG: hypothetical protein EOP49_23885, partial [Sphingobacteriales bacterium]
MKFLLHYFTPVVLSACISFTALAQSKNYYYDQTTRYGTFRHYSNGGSKLVSGRDYAAEMAASQREAAQMAEERARQRQKELERMRNEQNRAYNTSTGTPQKNYGPTPADLARQQQEKDDAQYRDAERRLEKAENVDSQWLILNEMQSLRPSDAIVLQLIALRAQAGDVEGIERQAKTLSDAGKSSNREAVEAACGSAYFRTMKWDIALWRLNGLQTQDLNSTAEILTCLLRLNEWDELNARLQKGSAAFPELSPLATHLTAAATALKQGESDTTRSSATAAALHRFAVVRRESRRIDCLNILALDAAVRLSPENATYREERFNTNAVLKLKLAM